MDTSAANAAAAAEGYETFLATKLGEWDAASAAARADLQQQIVAKGETLKATVEEATRVFNEKQQYKRHYIAGLKDHYKQERLTQKVDLEDQLYGAAIKQIWTGFGDVAKGLLSWMDEFLKNEGDDLTDAQDAAGVALADALAGELERLGEQLGAIGDAFFEYKGAEIDRLNDALNYYGYGDYKPDYTPEMPHEDEEMEDPVEYTDDEDDHYAEAENPHIVYHDDHYHEPSYHEPSYHEPSYHEPSYHEPHYEEEEYYEHVSYESESTYYEPSYHHEPSYHEPSYHSYHEPSYHSEPSYHDHYESESTYYEPSHHDYDHVETYRPAKPAYQPPVHQHAASLPDQV